MEKTALSHSVILMPQQGLTIRAALVYIGARVEALHPQGGLQAGKQHVYKVL